MGKKCSQCLKVKSLKEFYAHPKMADGHFNQCKLCIRSNVKANRLKRLEYFQAYDRNRPNQDERKEAVKKRYRVRVSTPEGRRRELDSKLEWAERNRHKRIAHWTVGKAIRDGFIYKDDAECERCGATENLHAHHEDYRKPLEINWLCQPCHGQRHREINDERRL